MSGVYGEFPQEFEQYYGPEYLETIRSAFETASTVGMHLSGTPKLSIEPFRGYSKDGSLVALRSCYDARGLEVLDAGNNVLGEGLLIESIVLFRDYEGSIKIFALEEQQVSECSTH